MHGKVVTVTCLLMWLFLSAGAKLAGAADDVTDGLLAYWPLDGSIVEKVRGVDLQPTQVRTAFLRGVAGSALQGREGNGESGGVVLSRAGKLKLEKLNTFTVSAWYRIDDLGGPGEKSAIRHSNGLLGWYNPDSNALYYFNVRHRNRRTRSVETATLKAVLPTRVGKWYHVVQRVDSQGNHSVWHADHESSGHGRAARASQRLPVFDGLSLAGGLGSGPLMLGYYETKAGKGGGKVSADEIAIWNRALSVGEIQWLFRLGRAGHAVTSGVSVDALDPLPVTAPLPMLRDFGWTSPWRKGPGDNPANARLQTKVKSTGELAIATVGSIMIERQFPRVTSGRLKVEYRVRPKHVTVEVNSPGASVMKTYLYDSRRQDSWTMRWHFPWAWPAIGGNTVPRFYVTDGAGQKRKGLEFTDLLMKSKTWYRVATILDLDRKTWEFWVDGKKFDTNVNLKRSEMRWWKTSAEGVDVLRFTASGWHWVDAFRVYHNDRLIAKTDFTSEEGYVPSRSIFAFDYAGEGGKSSVRRSK